ncbi:MAG: NEW3 domain-containing protein [Acidobacteriota bacterium]|nr:NEW3 domain-containing protein [Blastocatellia bacterium]MDW8240833.1 NEW3 domain-containing protein [Acidobacteriota bacterium]
MIHRKASHRSPDFTWLALAICLLIIFCTLLRAGVHAGPSELPQDRGISGLWQSLERLPVVASALHTTAHPDDEDTGLLVYLSRRVHARTSLLSATRGEGGQSIIGPETGPAMGLVRSGELLASAQYYGVDVFFTRAYEFGYSKTAEETLAKWGREETLADFVRVIRQTRPDVIITRFDGSPVGHGHHQAAGLLTREAFRAAADPSRFPEQLAAGLRPWQAKKLYWGGRGLFGPPAETWNVKINIGQFDAVLGQTYHEMGIEGLSKQRSQGVAAIIPRRGPLEVSFTRLDSVIQTPEKESGLYDGIDTTITGIASRIGAEADSVPELTTALGEIQRHALAALAAFAPRQPEAAARPVLAGLKRLRQLISAVEITPLKDETKHELLFLLRRKEQDFADAARRALQLEFDVRASDDTVIPGQQFTVTAQVYNHGREAVEPTALNLSAPSGWQVALTKGQLKRLSAGEHVSLEFKVTVAADAPYTQPYWYLNAETDNRYELRSEQWQTWPFEPPVVVGRLTCRVHDTTFDLSAPIRAPELDRLQGVLWRDVQVVPAVSVKLTPTLAIVPLSPKPQERQWRVTVVNHAPSQVEGTVQLHAPSGWRVTPPALPFRCARQKESATLAFRVTIPAGHEPQQTSLKAVARVNGQAYSSWYQAISYPDIWTRHLYHPAECRVRIFDIKVAPNLTVGYIPGPQDEIPEALRQLGVTVRLLEADELAFGDLQQFDCIIAGVRAYEFRNDLTQHNQRLLDYVREGGVFIVQYNTSRAWDPGQYAPYPAKMVGNERITVEESPVEILAPEHPVFNRPNKITTADFDGWVQERGLYFWTQWDERYRSLLAGHDPGESPQKGGWLEATYGKGLYVYTAYAWFRQLPAGVPGAYRLFANLISLPKTRS